MMETLSLFFAKEMYHIQGQKVFAKTRPELFLAPFCKRLLFYTRKLKFFLFSFVLPSSMAHFYLCAHVLSNFLCALLLFFNLAIGVVMHCWSYYQSYAGRWVCLFLVLWLSLCSQAHGFASKITKVLQDYLMAHQRHIVCFCYIRFFFLYKCGLCYILVVEVRCSLWSNYVHFQHLIEIY